MLRLPASLLALLLMLAGAGASADAPTPLSLERLYRLPWITGTAPTEPHWAADSRRVAFLWNDDGSNFRDVWIADVAGTAPRRLAAMPRPAMTPTAGDDVAQLARAARAETDPGVTSLAWAPDGRHVVFGFHDRLYRVLDGGSAEPLTAEHGGGGAPTPAPRGAQLAYLGSGGLWVIDPAAAAPTPRQVVTPAAKDVEVEAFWWSADGQRLAFIETDSRRITERGLPDYLADETRLVTIRRAFPGEPAEARRIGIVELNGGPVRWLDLGPDLEDQIFAVAWSPDGRSLLVDKSDLYIKDRRIVIVDAASLATRTLVHEAEPANVTAEWWADWAPDGRGVYFVSDRDNDYHLYRVALDDGRVSAVTAGDWAIFSATVSAAAGALIVIANPARPEDRQVLRVPLAGGSPTRLGQEHGHHEPVVSPDGRWLADVYSNDVTPPELYLSAAVPGGSIRALTHSPLAEFSSHRWVAARYVEFPSVEDGTTLHARLTLPPDFDPAKKYPAILGSVYSNTVHNRWGGRIYHPTWALDQYLAQAGYVIMNIDIRGSSGHGKRFRQRLREDYGGIDVEDLYSGVRYLVDHGSVDPRRVGLWGSSYGGLLTTMSLFKKPGVYAAGVAGAPATSLWHAETGEMRTMMAPRDHAERYAAASPFLRSDGLRDPLLIIHGMRDDTVLFKDTLTLTQRLVLQGHDVELVVLPDAAHGWDTQGLAQTRFAFSKLVEFFRRHLGEGPSP